MKYYIAGPMRGIDQFNFPEFDRIEHCLKQMGHAPVNPAAHDRGLGFDETLNSLEGFDMEAAMKWDVEQILHCDGVVLLAGWEKSRGARLETEVARLLGKPVYHVVEGLMGKGTLNLVEPSSFEMQNARLQAGSSSYLDKADAKRSNTGGVPL